MNVQASPTSWDPDPGSSWDADAVFRSGAITVTGAAIGDVCMVSFYGSGTKSYKLGTGDNKDFALSCYCSGTNQVKLLLSIGGNSISEGTQNNKLAEDGKFNIAVIDITP